MASAIHFKKLNCYHFMDSQKSPKTPFSVIPVKTGIQKFQEVPDFRVRGSDDCGDFLRGHQTFFVMTFLVTSVANLK